MGLTPDILCLPGKRSEARCPAFTEPHMYDAACPRAVYPPAKEISGKLATRLSHMPEPQMYRSMYGPEITFAGVPRVELSDVGAGQYDIVFVGAPFDGETSYRPGTPMRRLIESGAIRGDRFLQIGLRGYWPEPPTLAWMARQRMRSFEMTEIVARGMDEVLSEAFTIATDDCDAVFLSVDVDVVDPGMAPGTGTPEPGGLTGRQLLDAVRRIAMELPLAGLDVVEVAPPYDHAEVTGFLANRVVLEALSGIACRRRLLAGDPARPAPRPEAPLLDGPGT